MNKQIMIINVNVSKVTGEMETYVKKRLFVLQKKTIIIMYANANKTTIEILILDYVSKNLYVKIMKLMKIINVIVLVTTGEILI